MKFVSFAVVPAAFAFGGRVVAVVLGVAAAVVVSAAVAVVSAVAATSVVAIAVR